MDIEDVAKILCRKTKYLLIDKKSGARRLDSLSVKLFCVPSLFILPSFHSIRTPFQKNIFMYFFLRGGEDSKLFVS